MVVAGWFSPRQHPRRFWLVTMPCSLLVGYLLGAVVPAAFGVLTLLGGLAILLVMLVHSYEESGYARAQVEIAEVMHQIVQQHDKTDAQMLDELVTGIILQTVKAPGRRRNGARSWLR